jgi:TPP-dependent 2-oxoacid decarboxylase
MSQLKQNVSSFLIESLCDYGVRHIFGVPGDFVLGFYQELVQSNKLKVINTCDEQGAAFAADAYARINGLGAVCVTYCVGGLKVVNATAQAFAEESPLVVISGAPGMKERKRNPLLHHKVRDFDTQQKIFEHITVDSVLIDNPTTASKDIDRVLSSAIRYKRPVYIELPRDRVSTPIPIYQEQHEDSSEYSKTIKTREGEEQENTDMDSMQEALAEAIEMINSSKQPVIISGVEIHRFGLQDKLLQLTAKTNIPVVATVLSKSVISEDHPLYLGLYEGAMGHQSVREYVESSDCLILLGALMTDFNFSITPTPIEQSKNIYITSEKLSIKYHNFENVLLQDFLTSLIEAPLARKDLMLAGKQYNIKNNSINKRFSAARNQKITVKRLFERLNFSITDNVIVIADVGDSLFGALDLTIHGQTDFLSPAYYSSMGFAVPAAIGVQLAKPMLRPMVIVGDGAFQMTGMEISTITRFTLNPIIIVLNNSGYGTVRHMLDGPFNDVLRWNYYRIPEIIGHGKGFVIETEDQFEESLSSAEKIYSQELCILDVRLDIHDGSPALQRLTESLGKKVHQSIK